MYLVKLFRNLLSFKLSLPAPKRLQALALYKEGYEIGQTIYRRKVNLLLAFCL